MDDYADDSAIAIVGMALRTPGARNVDEFWQLIASGSAARTDLADAELLARGVPASQVADANYVKAGMFLDDMELFDGDFFGLGSRESDVMDPQHRHFLEVCWEALEAAGYSADGFDGAIGVFAGSGHNAYMPLNLFGNEPLMNEMGDFLVRHTGNDKDFLTTRVSYSFGLTGPSVNVATACSTSLVAVHLAAQSLLSGESDLALAGGVTIVLPHGQGYLYKDGEILSQDGICRPFDAASTGTLFGSGAGVVVLKRLDEAIADRDDIRAVIRGTAINNDGAGKVSYLAPSVGGQAACIAEAIEMADVDPETIGLVEAHGTGTAIGDPIEVAALTQAFSEKTDARQYCALSSVKGNVGHLDTAAGVASLIKAVLAIEHGQIPPTANFSAINPAIAIADTPFYVTSSLTDWPDALTPRRAGVSSLGVGGTNAHVIVEGYQPGDGDQAGVPDRAQDADEVLVLSAKSATALADMRHNLAAFMEREPVPLPEAAYTLAVGRSLMPYRFSVAVRDTEELILRLNDANAADVPEPTAVTDRNKKVAFMFAGGGSQYPNMGRDLYLREPVFRRVVDECLEILAGEVDFDLRALLFPEPEHVAAAQRALQAPTKSLTALFVTQLAQARVWQSWGVQPVRMIGHSMGENTAACVAGVFQLEDALRLVALRGQLFERTEPGGMLSVPLAPEQLEPYLNERLSIACINAPGMSVASGTTDAIADLAKRLAADAIDTTRILIDVAAHSPTLDPILEDFRAFLNGLTLSAPQIPFVSNLTGTWIRSEDAVDPEYWVRQMRQTVRFSEGLRELVRDDDIQLLEVGPGKTLTSLAAAHPGVAASGIVQSLPPPEADESDYRFMKTALGSLWALGGLIDWDSHYRERPVRRRPLPTYPFERRFHWITPVAGESEPPVVDAASEEASDWLYQRAWSPASLRAPEQSPGCVVALVGASPLHSTFVGVLRQSAETLVTVKVGDTYEPLNRDLEGTIRPFHQDDLEAVLEDVRARVGEPQHLFDALRIGANLTSHATDEYGGERWPEHRALAALAKAIAGVDFRTPLVLHVITEQAMDFPGDPVDPAKAMVRGGAAVIPREIESVRVHVADWGGSGLDLTHPDINVMSRIVADMLAVKGSGESVYRGALRYVGTHQRLAPANVPSRPQAPRVVLVTGGLGGIGLRTLEQLAGPDVALIVVCRSGFIPRAEWDQWLEKHDERDPVSDRILLLRRLESLGASVRVEIADVTDRDALSAVIQAVDEQVGPIDGVVHAAGHLEHALLLEDAQDVADRVLFPKIIGAENLQACLGERRLNLFLVYSSVSAFAGMAGQFDYAAANAYLDAFAVARADGGATASIGWVAWRESGMAVDQRRDNVYRPPMIGNVIEHPLLSVRRSLATGRMAYARELAVADDWVLREHRLRGGSSLMPGAGYLEMVHLAGAAEFETARLELRDVAFIEPFLIGDDERKEIRLQLQRTGASGEFSIYSESRSAGAERIEHATGTIQACGTDERPPSVDLQSLLARCRGGEQTFDDADHHPHLDFGDRWRAFKWARFGDDEAIIKLELGTEFRDDLDQCALHPAMIDMATAGAQKLIPGMDPEADFYVPLGYSSIRVFERLPAECFSHVRHLSVEAEQDTHGLAVFDIDIYDPSGNLLIAIEQFMVQRVDGLGAPPDQDDDGASEGTDLSDGLLDTVLERGLSDAQGDAALAFLLGHALPPTLVVSPTPLQGLLDDIAETHADAGSPEEFETPPELLEVEEALLESRLIADCAVRRYGRGDKDYIVAHVVFADGAHATVSEMRGQLRNQLRGDLLPKHFEELHEIPRLGDGRVDGRRLTDPLALDDYVAPRDDIESAIADIWQSILGIERVSVHDNFFDIGGHSILSIRAIAAIDKKLGVRLQPKSILLQTLEQIARECGEQITPSEAGEAEPDTGSRGLLGRILRR